MLLAQISSGVHGFWLQLVFGSAPCLACNLLNAIISSKCSLVLSGAPAPDSDRTALVGTLVLSGVPAPDPGNAAMLPQCPAVEPSTDEGDSLILSGLPAPDPDGISLVCILILSGVPAPDPDDATRGPDSNPLVLSGVPAPDPDGVNPLIVSLVLSGSIAPDPDGDDGAEVPISM